MSYANYVLAAYAVFVLALLWDFFATRVRIRRLLRAAKLLAARHATRQPAQEPQR